MSVPALATGPNTACRDRLRSDCNGSNLPEAGAAGVRAVLTQDGACAGRPLCSQALSQAGHPLPGTAASGAPQSSTWLTIPSASFGSNQVDLGGMMPPASATAITSSIWVG
jgi:hypothetical protein